MTITNETLLDDFNRSNGAVSAGAGGAIWAGTVTGAGSELSITSSQIGGAFGNNYTHASLGPDFDVAVTLAALGGSSDYVFLAGRVTSPGSSSTWDGYGMLVQGSGTWDLRRYDNGSGSVLGATATQALEAGGSIGLSVRGSTIEGWYKPPAGSWTLVLSRSDGAYGTAGRVVMEVSGSAWRVDDIRGGTVEPPPSSELVLTSEFASSTDADPQVVPLGTKTDGRELYVLFTTPSTPASPPSPWVEVSSLLRTGGTYYVKLWRLPAANNTSGVTTLSIDLSAARPLAAVVFEDTLSEFEASSNYEGIVSNAPTGADPALWGTGLHTFDTKDHVLAFFVAQDATLPGPSWDLASFDHSFESLGDSGWPAASSVSAPRIWVAQRDSTSLASDGIVATATAAVPGDVADPSAGIVAFDVEEITTPILVRSPATLDFDAVIGEAAPASQTVSVTNGGAAGDIDFTVSDDAAWLTVSPTSGSAPQTLTVSIDHSGLIVGSYSGTITITATGVTGSPQTVAVDLDVTELVKLTIEEENELPGTPYAGLAIGGAGDLTNLGFARPFSLNVGDTVEFCCHGAGDLLDIYRIGWYGGDGWSHKGTIANDDTTQPEPVTIPSSNGQNSCSNWTATAEWDVPSNATPGLYCALYQSSPGPAASYIPFVVHDLARPADIMVKVSDSTWALAYNYFGTMASPLTGKSLYGSGGPIGTGGIANRGLCGTYEKPIITRQGIDQTYWLNSEAPLIRFLERNGYDVTYSASRDWRESPTAPNLPECSIYISSGHDEYWSVGMRNRWEALRGDGKHLLFMSGNEVFWRTRFGDELSEAGSADVMWCFKDTMDGPSSHVGGVALDPVTWTGTWRDTRWVDNEPDNELTGTLFGINGLNSLAPVVDSASLESDHQFWRNTTVAASGFTGGSGLVGFEADHKEPSQPEGSYAVLAQTDFAAGPNLSDANGQNYTVDGTLEWGIVSQRFSSGAVVVGFGSCQWAWGLDASHDRGTDIASTIVQQAMVNLLADLGAQPDTLMVGLTAATPVSLDNYGAIPTRSAELYLLIDGEWVQLEVSAP